MFEHSKQGAVDLLVCREPLTTESSDAARQLVEPMLSVGQPCLVLAMDQMALLDSCGLELLLDWKDACTLRGGDLRLCGVNELCREILEITDTAQAFEMHEDSLSAIGSFSQ